MSQQEMIKLVDKITNTIGMVIGLYMLEASRAVYYIVFGVVLGNSFSLADMPPGVFLLFVAVTAGFLVLLYGLLDLVWDKLGWNENETN